MCTAQAGSALVWKQLCHIVPQASCRGQIKYLYNAISIALGPQSTSCPKPMKLRSKISFVSSRHHGFTIIDFWGMAWAWHISLCNMDTSSLGPF